MTSSFKSQLLADYSHPLCQSVIDKEITADELWQKIATSGTPLIEDDPFDADCKLVTFIFQNVRDAEHVCIKHGFGAPKESRMSNIADTDILHLSYRFEKDTRLTYSFCRDMPLIDLEVSDEKALKAFYEYLQTVVASPDPLNPQQCESLRHNGEPEVLSVLALEDSLSDEYSIKRAGIERGWLHLEEFNSEVLNNSRNIWVYSPPGYDESVDEYPVLLLLDGGAQLGISRAHRILDNLITDEKIPPLMAVFIDDAKPPARNVELCCSDLFATFVEAELIPWLNHHYPISSLPTDWYVTGASYGGLASLWLAYKMPYQIGNVISQSGSFWWGRGYPSDINTTSPLTADYERQSLIKDIANADPMPIKLWLEVGKLESEETMVKANRAMRDILVAKGYDLEYREFGGPHNFNHWRTSLPLALVHMMGDE